MTMTHPPLPTRACTLVEVLQVLSPVTLALRPTCPVYVFKEEAALEAPLESYSLVILATES